MILCSIYLEANLEESFHGDDSIVVQIQFLYTFFFVVFLLSDVTG